MDPTVYPSFRPITKGVDGTVVAILSHEDWQKFVNEIIGKPGYSEWYSTAPMKKVYNLTGFGYFPRGVTIPLSGSPTIIIDQSHMHDKKLIAHEYGHVLGYGHTGVPTTMNAVSWLRLMDNERLLQKFEQNFPELSAQIVQVRPLQVPTWVGALAILVYFTR